MRRTPALMALSLALPLLLQGCGDRKAASDEQSPATTSPAEQAAQPAQAAPAEARYVLSAADFDAYEKGMSRENEVLRSTRQTLKAARNASDSVSAMLQAQPQQTDTEGARAAGVAVERYKEIKAAVSDLLGRAEMGQMMQTQAADTTGMDEAMKARMRANMARGGAHASPYDGLPPDVASAFKARQSRLTTLRAENIKALFGVAGR